MLLHLPPEILNQIFILLPLESIVVCKRVNRYIRSLISASVEIQYLVQRLLSGHVENPYCSLSVRERLALLEQRNRTKWSDIGSRLKIKLPFRDLGTYELTEGVYLLGDITRRTLQYMYLPDKDDLPKDGEIEWKGKEVRMEDMVVGLGLNVYENDLLAVITVRPLNLVLTDQERLRFDIRLHFYEVSTGLPHPEAQQQVITVMQMLAEWSRPVVGIGIVGNNLVLILTFGGSRQAPDDHMFIYDWKSGVPKMKFKAPHQSHSGLIFVTQDIFLTPNSKNGTLEYWRIPKELCDAPGRPFFKLALPELYLRGNVRIENIQCHAEPNPTSGFRYSTNPFHPDPQRAIAIFNFRIHSRESRIIPPPPHPIRISCLFMLFVHRSSLVKCLSLFEDFISDHEDPKPVPYDDWGIDVCRWLSGEDYSIPRVATTSGQRCALFAEVDDFDPNSSSGPIILLDFNQTEVARVLATREHSGSNSRADKPQNQRTDEGIQDHTAVEIEDGDGDDDWIDKGDEEIITSEGQKLDDYGRCFVDAVYGRLPFKKCKTSPKLAYTWVLLDEQRFIGKRNDGQREIIYHGK